MTELPSARCAHRAPSYRKDGCEFLQTLYRRHGSPDRELAAVPSSVTS